MSQKSRIVVCLGAFLGIVSMLLAAQKIEFSDEALKKLAKDAYIWGYPLVVMQRSKQTFTKEGATPLNRFERFTELVTPSFSKVVTPNVDTLYATAWLDLKEPLVLSVPDTKGKYYVIQFLDAYTNVIKNIGKRTTGTKQGTYLIVGPNWKGATPEGMTLIQAPTNLVWLIARVLVQDDLPVVRDILSKIRLSPLSGTCNTHYSATPKGAPQQVATAGIGFFDELSAALKDNPPPAQQKGLVELFQRLGIGQDKEPSKELQDQKLRVLLEQAVAAGEKEIDQAIAAQDKKGWSYNLTTGTYGDNYLLRAAVAKQGLGANVPQEALYPMVFTDSAGQPLSGEHTYAIHFDTAPPVDAFWSLTLYDANTRLLVPNVLNRYSLSDRSKDDL